MTILVVILHVICCLLLIGVILLQGGRGQGLTGPTFGSGNVQSLFGTRAGDFLTKATSIAAICFLFTCIGLNWIEVQKSRSLLEGPRKVAPLDVEQVKKALEKIKAETPAAKTDSPVAAVKAEAEKLANETVPPIPSKVEAAAEKAETKTP